MAKIRNLTRRNLKVKRALPRVGTKVQLLVGRNSQPRLKAMHICILLLLREVIKLHQHNRPVHQKEDYPHHLSQKYLEWIKSQPLQALTVENHPHHTTQMYLVLLQ